MSYVYFLKRQLGGLIKIGYSKDPVSRMKSHRLNFGRMSLLGVIPGGKCEEQDIHKRFSHLQVEGHKSIKRQHMQEFFEPSKELMDFIASNVFWLDICDEMTQELTRGLNFTRSRSRAKRVLKAIDSGFDFEEIAAAYDVKVDSVYFVNENRFRVSLCRI